MELSSILAIVGASLTLVSSIGGGAIVLAYIINKRYRLTGRLYNYLKTIKENRECRNKFECNLRKVLKDIPLEIMKDSDRLFSDIAEMVMNSKGISLPDIQKQASVPVQNSGIQIDPSLKHDIQTILYPPTM